jgi:hypothetical protein
MPRIAIATFRSMPSEFTDDERLRELLTLRGAEAERIPWDATVDWTSWDLVVIRSTWDYDKRRDQFVAWAEQLGDRLHNRPSVVSWNSDKRYLRDLAEDGLPVVPTVFVTPVDTIPELHGEIVVKPTVSAGGRDTGRFSERVHDAARALIASIHASGRVAMIQPYLAGVDAAGETAVVCLDGLPSHVLHKRAVLRPDEVAPVRDAPDGTGAAEAMYSPDLVGPGEASDAELDLARRVIAHVTDRFGEVPLYARVDMVPGQGGTPVLMELEAVEPNLYLDKAAGEAAHRLATAILARL